MAVPRAGTAPSGRAVDRVDLAALLAFTYSLTQGDTLDADAFIAGWLPDVQAAVDPLERR